jgi:hypothetical protein
MRRLLLILGVVGALAAPVSAQAGTGVVRFPQEFVTPICNGDVLQLSGTLLDVETSFSGGFREQFQLQGTATDLTIGTVYHGTTFFRDLEITTPAGATVVTFTDGTRLESATGESVTFSDLLHLTITPDGITRADVEMTTVC